MTAPGDSAHPTSTDPAGLRERIAAYLRGHHVLTLATVGSVGAEDAGSPHAASVFYAADPKLRLVFLSKASSRHAQHVHGAGDGDAAVAATVTEEYADWREIRGVQLWGRAEVLRGRARAGALARYVMRFPFVDAFFTDPRFSRLMSEVEVIRLTPERLAFTDNRVGVFSREVIEIDRSGNVVSS